MIDASSIEALTFDCYGTLIDWETGITHALAPIAARAQRDPTEVVEAFGAIERKVQTGAYKPYREVCAEVTTRVARHLHIVLEMGEETMLADSIASWPAHPDTVAALKRLASRFRLAILSNIDRDLFEGTRPTLGVELDAVVTAEDVQSYKPDLAHFHRGLEVLGLPTERVLHVAESRFHDVEPANRMGIAVAHIDRSHGGLSASGAGAGEPDLVVHNLAELADALGV